MSQELIDRLVDLLGLEERLFRELGDLLRDERELILSMDAAGLDENVRKKDALAAEARVAEESRLEISQRLGETLGIVEHPVTLRALCERLEGRDPRLREAQTRLVALVGAVRELVEANRILGGERLTRVQTTLKLLGRLVPLGDETVDLRSPAGAEPGWHSPGRLLRTSA